MKTSSFLRSTGGRIASFTLGWGLAAPGILALMGPGPLVAVFIPLSTMACVVGALFAGWLAIRDFWPQALAMGIGLPFLGGFYLALMFWAPSAGSLFAGLALSASAAITIATAVAPRERRTALARP
jgi:hypothetical protein